MTVLSRISKWYFFSKIVWYRGSWTLLIWYGTSSVVTSRVILRQMTKIIEFKLNLDTHKNIFAPVDQIPCNVILTLDGQLQTKGIEVAWECKWKCAFISVQDAFLLPLLLFFFFFSPQSSFYWRIWPFQSFKFAFQNVLLYKHLLMIFIDIVTSGYVCSSALLFIL